MDNLPIQHCYWVVPGKFLAGEYPRNADEESSRAKIEALLHAGVTAFIDLTEGRDGLEPYDQFLAVYPPGSVVHQRFPIRDLSTPATPEQTIDILNAIDAHLEQGRRVYLHCWGGVGRTGVIVGCWLARHGPPGQPALDRLHELWEQNPKSLHRASPETRTQEAYVLGWREAR